ncbi:hypothetical protein RAD15_03865 [Bradyrhizobium sp. 14AA]
MAALLLLGIATRPRLIGYPLYRVMNIFDALVKYALEHKANSSIVVRIEKIRDRLFRALDLDHRRS